MVITAVIAETEISETPNLPEAFYNWKPANNNPPKANGINFSNLSFSFITLQLF